MSVYLRPAKDFECHYTKVDLPEVPHLIIGQKALNDMEHMVNLADKEVGWFGTVEKRQIQNRDLYLLDGVYLVEQKVHETTTEISPEGLANLVGQLMSEDGGDYFKRAGRLFCWGHSHVNMEPLPSGQDEKQFKELIANDVPYMIRIICNKKGRLIVDIYDKDNALIWNDVPWSIENHNEGASSIEEDMKRLVSEIKTEPKNKNQAKGKIVSRALNIIRKSRPSSYEDLLTNTIHTIFKIQGFGEEEFLSVITGLSLAYASLIGDRDLFEDLCKKLKENKTSEEED